MALIRTIGTTSGDRYAASCAISGICRVTDDASADGLTGDEPPGRWLIAAYRAGQGDGAAAPHLPAGRPPSGWSPAAGDGPGRAGPSRRVLPQQLPPTVTHFTGRTAELAVLDGWLHRAAVAGAAGTLVISAIGGMAGVNSGGCLAALRR
jgi:hypothetical protein